MKSLHSKHFLELLAARRQALLESLAVGHLEKTYWILVGTIQGLDEALKLSDEADYKISGEDNAGA